MLIDRRSMNIYMYDIYICIYRQFAPPSIPGSNIAPSDVVRSITLIRVWETVILEDTSLASCISPRNSVNWEEKALGSDLYIKAKHIGKEEQSKEMIFSTNSRDHMIWKGKKDKDKVIDIDIDRYRYI